jgi:hypothetical protein
MFEELAAAIGEVRGTDAGALDDDELGDALVELHRLRSQLEAAEAALTSQWDARRCWVVNRARSGAAWLAWRTHMPMWEARRQVRVARALRSMPATEAAFDDGELSIAQVSLLARARGHNPDDFERDEKLLVDQAKDLKFKHFRQAIAYWIQLADPDGAEADAGEMHEARRAHVSQSMHGMWYGDFALDPLAGAAFNGVFGGIIDELFQADWAEARARLGRHPTVADLSRTAAQRRADAIVEMAFRAATAPAGGRRPAPLFSVFVGYETFAGRICELADGTVVTPGSLVPWLREVDVERIVFDTPARVMEVGEPRRLFTGALRKAVLLRDRACFHDTCDEPGCRCQVDHVIPAAAGGPTTQANGRAACGFHNRDRHRPRPPPLE